MRKALVLVSFCFSCISAFSAEAPPIEPDFSIDAGLKFAYLNNKMRYKSQYNGYQNISGFTGATLNWNKMNSKGIELTSSAIHNSSKVFAAFSITTGFNSDQSGNMRDIDYIASSGITIGDTISKAKMNHNYSMHLDFGRAFLFGATAISPSFGYYFSDTKMDAYGATLLPVGNNTVYSNYGLAPGYSIAKNIKITTEQAIVQAPRIALGLSHSITEKMTISIEPAYMPFANITFNDWHHISSDKVQDGTPNLIAKNTGSGYSIDADLGYKFSQNLSLSLAFKYSKFSMGETNVFNRMVSGNNVQPNGTKSLDFESLGFLFGAKYRFY